MQHGIHIVDKWTGNVPSEVYTSNAICITICRYWNNLNPSSGVYDWTDLDIDIANIIANGKDFSIKVAAGDKTPSWVYALPVTKLTFSEFVGDDNVLVTIAQPVFWEANYITAWTTFITALSTHLQVNPTVWAALSHVSITGINRKTDEYRICAQESEYRAPYTSSDAVALWNGAGYTEALILSTQQTFNTLFATQFSGKDLAFSMTNYGTTPPFPAITGWTDMNQNAIDDLAVYGTLVYGIYTSVKSNFVSATVTTQAAAAGLSIAGQLSEKQFGSGSATFIALDQAMQAAHSAGYKYMEIHDESVNNYNIYIPSYNTLFSSSNTGDMLVNKINSIEISNLLGGRIYDTTFNYNATTNPGGYGTPNPELADILTDTVQITLPATDYTATGNAYTLDMFPTLPNINPALYFTFLPTDVGYSTDLSPLLDGEYKFIRTSGYLDGSMEMEYVTTTTVIMYTGNIVLQLAQYYAKKATGNCGCSEASSLLAIEIEKDLLTIAAAMESNLFNKAAYIMTKIYRKLPKLSC